MAVAAAVLAVGWLVPLDRDPGAMPPSKGAGEPGPVTDPQAAYLDRSRAPLGAVAVEARNARRALWQERLARAESAFEAYRQSTRYPHASQPLARHSDQAYPNRPIVEERPFGNPAAGAAEGTLLRTTQERVFVEGLERVRLSVSLRDRAGAPLPLRILRSSAREITAPDVGSLYPEVPLEFNDHGSDGDAAAGDGTFGTQLQPATMGFAGLSGAIRAEVRVQHGAQEVPVVFDILYTSEAPATWQGRVREDIEDGSLNFHLAAMVRKAGRYVVTGRVDDANGAPLALLEFNEEVAEGVQEFRLSVFGKLIRDARPAFPLTLRDVDAFLLHADVFPDRSLMPRIEGPVHVGRVHPLESFSADEWQSEERSRYLNELGRDVAEARAQLGQIAQRP